MENNTELSWKEWSSNSSVHCKWPILLFLYWFKGELAAYCENLSKTLNISGKFQGSSGSSGSSGLLKTAGLKRFHYQRSFASQKEQQLHLDSVKLQKYEHRPRENRMLSCMSHLIFFSKLRAELHWAMWSVPFVCLLATLYKIEHGIWICKNPHW